MTRTTYTIDYTGWAQLEQLAVEKLFAGATRSSGIRRHRLLCDRAGLGVAVGARTGLGHRLCAEFIAGRRSGHPGHPAVHAADAAEGRLGTRCI